MRKRLLSLALLVLLLSLWLPVKYALACSCVADPNAKESTKGYDAVFSGTIEEIRDPEGQGKLISSGRTIFYTFDVDAVVKGDVSEKQVVGSAADSASCGYVFKDGSRYLVYADREGEKLTTQLCSFTREMQPNEEMPFEATTFTDQDGGGEVASEDIRNPVRVEEGSWVAAAAVGAAAGFAVSVTIVLLRRRRTA